MLKAYFDATGTSNVSEGIFALCGFIAPEDAWVDVEKNWDGLLKSPCKHPPLSNPASVCKPLDYLHAVEMEKMGKKRFRRIGQRNRDYLISSSIGVILSSSLMGVASLVHLDSYGRVDDDMKEIINDPYYLCFQHVIVQAASLARAFIEESPQDKIAFMFDDDPTWSTKLHGFYNLMKPDYGDRYRMGAVAFGDMREHVPLQVADRLCYETHKHYAGTSRHGTQRLWNSPLIHGRKFDDMGFASLRETLIGEGKLK